MKPWWLVLIVACSYGDPTPGVMFKCDAAHGCPGGEPCVNGHCSGGTGMAGVACGAGGTCGPDTKCCYDFMAAPHCIATATICAGAVATCDGPADCTAPSQCCGMGSASCGSAGCTPRVCTIPEDCPASQPGCCFTLPGVPWGMCSASPC